MYVVIRIKVIQGDLEHNCEVVKTKGVWWGAKDCFKILKLGLYDKVNIKLIRILIKIF